MRILFLTHSFNSLAQRLYCELRACGHEISIEFDIADSFSEEAVALFRPDLLLAPFLKRAIPATIWRTTPCFIVHPGIADAWFATPCHLFDARPEAHLRGTPGSLLARPQSEPGGCFRAAPAFATAGAARAGRAAGREAAARRCAGPSR